eukprot:Amastigsp_a516845_25.p3 type:complete len:121 gc:universal Amastigsp_a516845_25:1076-1438(+)
MMLPPTATMIACAICRCFIISARAWKIENSCMTSPTPRICMMKLEPGTSNRSVIRLSSRARRRGSSSSLSRRRQSASKLMSTKLRSSTPKRRRGDPGHVMHAAWSSSVCRITIRFSPLRP